MIFLEYLEGKVGGHEERSVTFEKHEEDFS